MAKGRLVPAWRIVRRGSRTYVKRYLTRLGSNGKPKAVKGAVVSRRVLVRDRERARIATARERYRAWVKARKARMKAARKAGRDTSGHRAKLKARGAAFRKRLVAMRARARRKVQAAGARDTRALKRLRLKAKREQLRARRDRLRRRAQRARVKEKRRQLRARKEHPKKPPKARPQRKPTAPAPAPAPAHPDPHKAALLERMRALNGGVAVAAPSRPLAAPPPPGGRPGHTPVSHAIRTAHLDPAILGTASTIKAVEMVGQTISDGPLAPVHMQVGHRNRNPRMRGSYSCLSRTANLFEAGAESLNSRITVVHELGHWLDNVGADSAGRSVHRGFGTADGHRSGNRERDAAADKAHGQLSRAMRQTPEVQELLAHASSRTHANRKWARYATAEHELFARAFAQMVVYRRGDRVSIDHLEATYREKGAASGQWSRESFRTIEGALVNYLEARGFRVH